MKKTGKGKVFLIGISAFLLASVSVGTLARIGGNKEEKEPQKQEESLPAIEWEQGMFMFGSGSERDFAPETGMPNCYRTNFIPYNEFNCSWESGSGVSYAKYLLYDENKEYLKETEDIQEFVWENRESYNASYGALPPDSVARYVRICVMAEDSETEIHTDKITVTFKSE